MKLTELSALPRVLAAVFACCLLPALSPLSSTAASGNIYMITSNPSYEVENRGFAGFLRSLGYSVTVGEGSCDPYLALDTETPAVQAAKIAQLESYDLIIIHRNFGSGTLNTSPTERAIWNHLKVPILLCNAPIARNNVWRWFDGSSGAAVVPKDILIEPPGDHPIVAGLGGSLFGADRPYGGFGGALGGTDGGTNMMVLARINAFGGVICMAVWDEAPGGTELRGFYASGGETYYRRRVFFELHEYRNTAPNPDPWLEVTANGRLLYAGAVQYAMHGVVTPPPQVNNLLPADKTVNYDPTGGLSFDVASPLPVSDSNILLKLNGTSISGGLVFSGPNTNRHVSYSGLVSNLLYNVEIGVSNAAGSRTVLAQFDTFVAGQTTIIPTADGINYNGVVAAGDYNVYLEVGATARQVLRLHRGTSASSNLQGILVVPNTGGLSPAEFTRVPLTDALGNLSVLRLSGSEDFLLDLVDYAKIYTDNLLLVPAAGVPATLKPMLVLASPAANAVNVSPLTAIDLTIVNRDSAVVPGSIQFKLGGIDRTSAATITPTVDGATLHYQPSVFLTPSSTYTVEVTFADNLANSVTNQYSFQTRVMPAIPAAFATPVGSGINRGFNVRNHMALTQSGVIFCANAARAELQLEGQFLGSGGQPVTNAINNTPFAQPYTVTSVLNYGPTENGTRGWFPADQLLPGSEVVGATNVAFEATAYLELKAGINRYGVRSSDGFRLTAGPGLPKDQQSVVIGSFDGARGDQVPSEGAFLVYKDGLYAFRLLFHKAANNDVVLEWYSRTNDVEFVNDQTFVGDRTLINDLDTYGDTPTPAYRQRTVEPARPVLTAILTGNALQISWNAGDPFVLQTKPTLADPTWTTVSQQPVVSGDLHTVTINNPIGTALYRLRNQ